MSSSHKPITINATDPHGNLAYTKLWDNYEFDITLSNLTETGGWYTVEASSPIDRVRKNYACTYYFNVVPENPLGTIGSAATILLALSFYGLVRRRRPRYIKPL